MVENIFQHKRVLITGASKGLGAAFAQLLARQGAALTLIARSGDLLKTMIGLFSRPERHAFIELDLLDNAVIYERMQTLLQNRGTFDLVIHCAGGGLGLHDALLTSEQMLRSFQLNVAAGIEINRALVPEMQKQQQGTIIHIGSVASLEAHGSVSYNTSKAALAAYVRSIGRVLIQDRIVVTGMMPGGYETHDNSVARLKKDNFQQYSEYLDKKPPRKKLGDIEELLPLLLVLAGKNNGMMAGCLVPIDGGEGKTYIY